MSLKEPLYSVIRFQCGFHEHQPGSGLIGWDQLRLVVPKDPIILFLMKQPANP